MKTILLPIVMVILSSIPVNGQMKSDVIKTDQGDLEMFFIGHGSLMFKYNDLVIHIDPVSREADYAELPVADLILITHQHGDHLDAKALHQLMKEGTQVVLTRTCLEQLEDMEATVMANGDKEKILGIGIEAYPAYNIKHLRSDGNPYHPKGEGNAYLLSFGNTRVLVGGDTENVPELKALKGIQVAFLPMNLPYTMTPEMVADLAVAMQPEILYPYHYGETDPGKLVELLKEEKGIEVRIRDLQ